MIIFPSPGMDLIQGKDQHNKQHDMIIFPSPGMDLIQGKDHRNPTISRKYPAVILEVNDEDDERIRKKLEHELLSACITDYQ